MNKVYCSYSKNCKLFLQIHQFICENMWVFLRGARFIASEQRTSTDYLFYAKHCSVQKKKKHKTKAPAFKE